MTVVSPYKPFVPESAAHRKLGAFDWEAAFAMLRDSVERTNGCETVLLGTEIPTRSTRLMPWIIEVALRYLESDAFDQDTVFVSPDTLVLKDLRFGFAADLGVIVRTQEKFATKKPILNSVQWWTHDAKDRLIAFYRQAFALTAALEDGDLRWGGDTVPLVRLLEPVTAGLAERSGLTVYGWVRSMTMATVSSADIWRLDNGFPPLPTTCALVDFKYFRKHYMQKYFERTVGVAA